MTVRYLLDVRGLRERTGDAERQKLIALCDELRIDPNAINVVISHESGWRPDIRNPRPGQTATGLIQFIESTARGLGTSTAALARMSTLEQLDYVARFYAPFRGRIRTPADALMAAFLPIYVGKPLDFVIAQQGGTRAIGRNTEADVYANNAGFDKEKKGFITVADVTRNARRVEAEARARPPVAVPYPEAPSSPDSDESGGGLLAFALLVWFLSMPVLA